MALLFNWSRNTRVAIEFSVINRIAKQGLAKAFNNPKY